MSIIGNLTSKAADGAEPAAEKLVTNELPAVEAAGEKLAAAAISDLEAMLNRVADGRKMVLTLTVEFPPK
jgi:hypothetical protein